MDDSQAVVPVQDRLFLPLDPPDAAAVIVWRPAANGDPEFLLLHRNFNGTDYEGDWAWGPPAGGRLPGEPPEACARRELREETGLAAPLRPLATPTRRCAAFTARVEPDAPILLSDEHDRFAWVDRDEAVGRCRPRVVADLFRLELTA